MKTCRHKSMFVCVCFVERGARVNSGIVKGAPNQNSSSADAARRCADPPQITFELVAGICCVYLWKLNTVMVLRRRSGSSRKGFGRGLTRSS